MIQKEIGESSWFGFSFVIKPSSGVTRKELVAKLTNAGIECRPIVAGNFAKNEALKWMDYEIHQKLKNADRIDEFGLFIGNHHVDMSQGLKHVSKTLEGLK
jgi:CDP-6-deoxy-D-xylo-4-hexulose-3-dehydrase